MDILGLNKTDKNHSPMESIEKAQKMIILSCSLKIYACTYNKQDYMLKTGWKDYLMNPTNPKKIN